MSLSTPILQTEHVSRAFGGLQAVRDISISVDPDCVYAIIGPNGAGKTTFFNIVSGRIRPDTGRVLFKGRNITSTPVRRMAHLGIGRAFQITSLFPQLSVLENVRLAAQARGGDTWRFWRSYRAFPHYIEQAETVLSQVGLLAHADLPARSLSHGDQRKLELAILLAGDPELLLLDEPTAGMASNQVPELLTIIERIRQTSGRTILLVEHRMDVVMRVANRIMVMHGGALLAEGTPAEIASNEQVQQAYLGGLYEDVLHGSSA